jgi:glycosyltransferase involved in cell wall biosynthesis
VRVAIVHERFTEPGGSEQVVAALAEMWPEAVIFAAVVNPSILPASLRGRDIRTSRLQRRYRGGGYAHLLPFLPGAFAHLDLSEFDLVITSHHAFANRVRPPAGIPVVSYTYTPARWIWEASMRHEEPGGPIGRAALATFAATQRRPDRAAAARLRGVIAISTTVAERVQRWWHRDAAVVAPPVDVERFTPSDIPRDDFFLWVGRLVPYKSPLIAVEAAARADVPLVMAGDGRMRARVERAAGQSVRVLGSVDEATLLDLYRRCQAVVFPGEEDFGLVPVEAQACGAPVIALGAGGATDTIVDGITGVLYAPSRDPVGALTSALRAFNPAEFDRNAIRENAMRFAPDRFRRELRAAIDASLATGSSLRPPSH